MTRRLQLALGFLLLTGVCADAQAQRHTRREPWIVSAPAGTQFVRAPLSGTTGLQNLQPSGTVVTPIIPSGSTVSTLINGGFPVPGFGFDYTHFAAVNRNLGVRALIDPVTQHQLALARAIRRETPVGAVPIAFPAVVNNIQIVVMQQPPVVILPQQTYDEPERVERVRYVEPEPASAALREPAPVAELGEIVLIRNDGTLVFAVAFSTHGDRLVYVTREGIRRSFLLRDLDMDATRQMNAERGTTLRLPA